MLRYVLRYLRRRALRAEANRRTVGPFDLGTLALLVFALVIGGVGARLYYATDLWFPRYMIIYGVVFTALNVTELWADWREWRRQKQ